MGNRLSRIVTRTGDDGQTGLAGGERVPKHGARICAIGEIDELNCCFGLLLCHPLPDPVRAALAPVQHELFDLGGQLAMPGVSLIGADQVLALEASIETLNADLPPLKDFILPGGSPVAAQAHLARAVCRRAERSLWALHAEEPQALEAIKYLNRLSDLMFVVSRLLARATGGEVLWQKQLRA